jgi:hypothetical protein
MGNAHEKCHFPKGIESHQRGLFPALAIGASFGGGQQVSCASFVLYNLWSNICILGSWKPHQWCDQLGYFMLATQQHRLHPHCQIRIRYVAFLDLIYFPHPAFMSSHRRFRYLGPPPLLILHQSRPSVQSLPRSVVKLYQQRLCLCYIQLWPTPVASIMLTLETSPLVGVQSLPLAISTQSSEVI